MATDDHRLAFIRDHCPKTTFHPHEQHFPCSIQHLLRDSTLKRRSRGTQDNLDTVKIDPTADELGEVVDDNYDYFVDIASSQLQGCPSADRAVNAPIYVSIVEVDGSFIDIYYISLYAFQGSATFRCCARLGHNYNVIANEFGRHQGDVEHCIVRTDLVFSHVLSVGYEGHDKIAWFFPGEYPEEHGHPLVYASLLNHASYFFNAPTPMPKGGTGDAHSQSQQQWAKTEEYAGILEPIDLIERHPDSRVWQPYLSDQDVIIISRDNPATKWVRYAGFLGAPLGTPNFTSATEVWGEPLGMMAKLYTNTIAKMAVVLKLTKQSDPTRGLGARHYIQCQHVSSWKHVQALSIPSMVLSVNPDDIDGPLIMAPVRDNDPHQLWHQDHWRQFGNAKVKNCIKVNGKEVIKGITETDHVNKEACVLISKSSRRLLCCGGRDQLLRLADYARGADGDAVRRAVVLDMDPQHLHTSEGNSYYAVRPVCDTCLNWTVVGCNVATAGWCAGPHQSWKIADCRAAQEVLKTAEAAPGDTLHSNGNRDLPESYQTTRLLHWSCNMMATWCAIKAARLSGRLIPATRAQVHTTLCSKKTGTW